MRSIQTRRLLPVLSATLAVALVVYGCGDGGLHPTPLSVTRVSPNNGASAGATVVTISGTGFKAGATVTMNGVVTNTLFVQPTAISVTTAAHAVGAVDVVVTNPDGQSASLTGGYTYVFVPPPVLLSISPAVGSTEGGVMLEVLGTGFTNVTLTIGGVRAALTSSLSTSLSTVAPPGAEGPADVVLTNADGQSSTLKNGFTYLPPSSFDFNGDWYGIIGQTHELSFTIRDNTLVSASCAGSSNLVTAHEPVPVANGSFSSFSVKSPPNVFKGRILADGVAAGSLIGTSGCDSNWLAHKR
jgi:hypothetical protein